MLNYALVDVWFIPELQQIGERLIISLKYDITHTNLSTVKFDIRNIFHSSNICSNDIHGEAIRDLCGVRNRSLDCIF